MNKILYAVLLTLILSLAFVQNNYAQDEWYQDRTKGIYSIGFGGTQGIGIYAGGGSTVNNIGMSINASGEYKIWKFIGLGWQSGLDILFPYYGTRYAGLYGYGYAYGGPEAGTFVGIPFMAKSNVHILDAAKVGIANKLDVYAGLTFGGGPIFYTGPGGGVGGIIHVGPQVGVRYWFNKKIAVFGEFGWAATFANAGVTL